MKKEPKDITENMKSFGEYEPLVRKWCKKHEMAYVMEEFKELFDMIKSSKPKKSDVCPLCNDKYVNQDDWYYCIHCGRKNV